MPNWHGLTFYWRKYCRRRPNLDFGGRDNFVDCGPILPRYPDFALRPETFQAMGCARLVVHGPEIDAVRERVNARCGLRDTPPARPGRAKARLALPAGRLRSRTG